MLKLRNGLFCKIALKIVWEICTAHPFLTEELYIEYSPLCLATCLSMTCHLPLVPFFILARRNLCCTDCLLLSCSYL